MMCVLVKGERQRRLRDNVTTCILRILGEQNKSWGEANDPFALNKAMDTTNVQQGN